MDHPQDSVPVGNGMRTRWLQMRPLFFVVLAMFLGTLKMVVAKLLETDNEDTAAMSPTQILFARFLITSIISHTYMKATGVRNAPFGPKEVRGYLIGRGVAGFVGVYCFFYSLQYFPTAVSTAFTFLTSVVGPWLSFLCFGDVFPTHERLAGAISMIGVLIVALPTINSGRNTKPSFPSSAEANEQALAVIVALCGVLSASVAYTMIRKVGNQAHSLIVINYLSDMATLFSFVALIVWHGLQAPSSVLQGFQLVALGILGFASQFFLTVGFQEDGSSSAAIMIYTQLLFAMGFDWILWHSSPSWSSWVGCFIILGSGAFVAVRKSKIREPDTEIRKASYEEEQRLMDDGMASIFEEENITSSNRWER